jgi:hypothetical protein
MTITLQFKKIKWWVYVIAAAVIAAAAVACIVLLPPHAEETAVLQETPVPTPVATPTLTPAPTVREPYIPDPEELQEIPAFDTLSIGGEIGVVRSDGAENVVRLSWTADPRADYYVLCVVDADHKTLREDILWPDIDAWEIPDFKGSGVLLLSYADMGEDSARDDVLEAALFAAVTRMLYGMEPDATAAPDEETDGLNPYYILVDKADHAFSVFTYDESGEYTIKVATFPCALGRSSRMTPTGTFSISSKGEWKRWPSGHVSPFYTRYTSGLYIHGPIYDSKHGDDMDPKSYEEIGTDASSGCSRTTVAGARFIYYNCAAGTAIEIIEETDLVSWPGLPEIDPDFPTWDPTDPLKPAAPEATPAPEVTPALEATPGPAATES